ncbi:unnamed protein product [Symbiodinium sp. CCMP2456]|nr:unnamed protein product [Symbiodinium sp. CCMP2456]
MIDYSESWLILTLLKWKGSVFPRSCLFALPAALITVVLVQAQDVLEFDLRQELGLMDAHRSQLWIISLGVLHALLVFRINRAMERFWEGTGLLHQMRGEWFDAVSCCVTFSRASMISRPQDTMRFRHAIVRLMSLCHGSALEEIGGEDGDFCETIDSHGLATRTLEHLTDCAEEYDFNRVEVLLHMIQSLITHNLDVGVLKVQPPILSRVYQTLSRGFVNLLNAKKIADTRFPFPFAQLISALLFLHVVLLPVLISAVISQAWLAFTFTFLPIFSMCCLNYIGVELENPFGRDDNDLPLKHFQVLQLGAQRDNERAEDKIERKSTDQTDAFLDRPVHWAPLAAAAHDPLWAPCNHKFCRHCIIQVLKSRAPEWAGDCPLCRIHISVYNLRDEHNELLVQPDVLELWGCIFVQNGQTGLASYHFDSPDQCYISYEQAPAHWRLDDGSKPPSKKYWTDVSFDAKTSTFRGAEMNNCLLMLLHYSADLMAGICKQRCLMDIMEIRKAMHGTLSESWLQETIDKAPGSPAEANVKDVEEEESQPNSVQEAGVEVVLPLATQGETSSDGGAAPIFEEPAFEEKLQPTTLLQGMDQAVMALTGIRQAIAMQATDVDRSIDGFLALAKKLRTQTDDLIADEAEPADVEFTFGWDCSAIPSFEASS